MRFLGLWIVAVWSAAALAVLPRVVRATPDNNAEEVDPNLTEIVVEFDQPMNQGGRSIVGGGDNFPEMNGQPHWSSPTTIVIPVKLQADHEYSLSINSTRFRNFTNQKGESAVPYPISFITAGGKKIAPTVQKKAVDALREAIDKNYAYRDLRKVDWNAQFEKYRAKLEAADTARRFARVVADLLSAAQDPHISLSIGSNRIGTFRRSIAVNVNFNTLQKAVPNWKKDKSSIIATGRFDDGISYLLIGSWPGDKFPDEAFEAIASADPAKGLIIDVRSNGGGDEQSARKVAGCFVSAPVVYSKNKSINDGEWSGIHERILQPNKSRPPYKGKVVVLIGQACMSSNESFVLMMKSAGAKLIGEKTYGSSGNPHPHDLGNGVTVNLPSWQDLFPDGTLLEGVGISPDVEVQSTPTQLQTEDPVLEAALNELRK